MNRQKTLLVLAASTYQLDAIRTALRCGYRVVTADNVPMNPGHRLAHKSYCIDTTDVEGILRVAVDERIDGVIAPCTDVAVVTAAIVAERLNLPGVPSQSAQIATDKGCFRDFLKSHGFAHPNYHVLERDQSPPGELFRGGCHWITKPDRSSGSKGIFIVRDDLELMDRLSEARSFSPTGRVVLESFLEGHQGTVEGILEDGKIALYFILDRQTAPAPYVTTTGHYLPSILTVEVKDKVLEAIARAWATLGVTDTAFDCDFVWANDRVYLLEITPRLGGNSISQLLRYASGFDLVEYAVRKACGDRVAIPSCGFVAQPTAVIILGVWTEGALQIRADPADVVQRYSWVIDLKYDVESGSRVHPFINGRHRIGELYINAARREDIPGRVEVIKNNLGIEVL